MAKYQVKVFQKVWESAIVEVEAKDEDEAGKLVLRSAFDGDVPWNFDGLDDDPLHLGDIVEVKEAEEGEP